MVQIIQGKKTTFTVRLTNKVSGDPYDLTPVTALTACFEKQDGTDLVLGLGTGIAILNAVLGKFSVTISAAQSALLAQIDVGTLSLSITTTGDPIGNLIPNAYAVVMPPC